MKILIFGSNGQMGTIFRKMVPKEYNIITSARSNLDLGCKSKIKDFITFNNPDIIINFAAYTDVEASEKNQDLAMKINAYAPLIIAKTAHEIGAIFLHISTDYVYNSKLDTFLNEETKIDPINVYGKSKALGEEFIQENCHKYLIFRTAWLYSDIKKNFFLTISNLIRSGKNIKVINDQFGAPTLVYDVIDSLLKILEILIKNILNNKNNERFWGVYNLSNGGETSWYDFACKIASNMGYSSEEIIIPINKTEYKFLAYRPHNSRLDNKKIYQFFGITLPHWEDSFKNFFFDKYYLRSSNENSNLEY